MNNGIKHIFRGMLMVFIPNPNARPVKVRNTKTWLLESLDDAAGFGMLDVEDPADAEPYSAWSPFSSGSCFGSNFGFKSGSGGVEGTTAVGGATGGATVVAVGTSIEFAIARALSKATLYQSSASGGMSGFETAKRHHQVFGCSVESEISNFENKQCSAEESNS